MFHLDSLGSFVVFIRSSMPLRAEMLARLTQVEFVPAARRFSQLQSLAAWFGETSYNTADRWSGKAQSSVQAPPTSRTKFATWRSVHTTPYAHAAAGKNDTHPPAPAEHHDDAVKQPVAPASAGQTPITTRQQTKIHPFCLLLYAIMQTTQILSKQ